MLSRSEAFLRGVFKFFRKHLFLCFSSFVNLLSESLLISGLRAFSIPVFFIAARVQVVSGALRTLRNVPCSYKENWYNAHLQIRISKDSENKFRRWIPKTFGWRKKGFPWGTARKRDFILLMFPGNISYIFT